MSRARDIADLQSGAVAFSSTISLTDSDVAHGMTGLLPTATYGQLATESGTEGGVRITTATEGATAYSVTATSTTPSTDGDGAVFRFRASKKSGTGEQALADTDDLMTIGNVGVEKVFIQGSGNVGINASPISYANAQATLFLQDDANPAIGISDTGQSKDYFIVANGSRLGIVYGDGSNTGSSSNITEIASFNNNGNVGIGTDSPSSDGGVTLEIRNDATPTLKLNDGGEYQGYLQLRGNDLEVRGSNGAMEFYTGAADGASSTLALTIDSSSFVKTASRLGVGENNPDRLLHLSGNVPIQRFTGNGNNQANYAYVEIEFENSDDSGSAFTVDASIVIRSSESNGNGGQMCFHTGVEGNSERMRISSTGDVSIGKSGVSTSTAGTDLYSYGLAVFVRNNGVVGLFNRLGGDGDLVSFRQDSSEEGTISVSGSTVSYNGFSGLHESSGIANNVAIGTVCSTIDELDVYPDSQPDGKGGTEDHPKKGQTRADHAKIKVSDTEGDKRVYGVLQRYDNNGKPLVASVGIGSIRVTGACEGGDLLESNGDGTAKVQSDDIIRSKTIGKVTIGNSDTGVKLVSCVLYCG
jgi:hypothetical protein